MSIFKKKEEEKSEKQGSKKTPSYSSDDALILSAPHISEKATDDSKIGQYVFKVSSKATKIQVRNSVERIYKVAVERVNILNQRPKLRRRGRTVGYSQGFKKAVVKLRQGDRIELMPQ